MTSRTIMVIPPPVAAVPDGAPQAACCRQGLFYGTAACLIWIYPASRPPPVISARQAPMAKYAAQDIPGVWMSSGGVRLRDVFPVAPGGGLVVAGPGLEASVQDADKAAGQSSEGVVVLESVGALSVVKGAGAG